MVSPTETYEQLCTAWASADAGAAAALYAPDAVWHDDGERRHDGRDAIAEGLRGRFATRGPAVFTTKRQVVDGDVVLTEWTRATDEAGRRSTGLPGATVIEVGPEGIRYHRDYA